MKTLSIDLETYSSVDLIKSGVYKYTESKDFEILLFAYAFDDEEVKVIDLVQGEKVPIEVMAALNDKGVTKYAHNANFEINSIRNFFRMKLNVSEWRCTMIQAMRMGLPSSLEMVGKALRFSEDKQKLKIGKSLIRYFCVPCKPTKSNKGRTRNLAIHDLNKWNQFKEYCKQDVEVERSIRTKLDKFNYSYLKEEERLWQLDQKINDTGLKIDLDFVKSAISCNNEYSNFLETEAKRITGLDNPNSTAQLKEWIESITGFRVESLNKDSIPKLLEDIKNPLVKRMLSLRTLMAKTSIKKYEAMVNSICKDGRVRGLLQFYGANRTGRWAGRLVQVQNLPQNHIPDLDLARETVKGGKIEPIELLFGNVPDTISQLIRTAFIPSEGNRFIVADFSAIEARVIAWLAGESWRLEVFKTHGKIYEASASQMFHVPIESIKKGSDLRQKGKIAELALGYGGGVGAIESMDKSKSIPTEELPDLVKTWRAANPNITKLWWDCDKAAKKAISEKTTIVLPNGIKFIYQPGVLFIELSSGRRLSYIRPRIEDHKTFNGTKITYEGMNQTTRQWTRLDTYGPKLVENIIQGIARDCLAMALIRTEEKGYTAVMHVHDEIIFDVPKNFGSIEEINNIFAMPIEWAKGLPLKADGYECNYYQKD